MDWHGGLHTIGFHDSGCTPSEAADFSFSLSESNETVLSRPGVSTVSIAACVAVFLRSASSFWSWATWGEPELVERRTDIGRVDFLLH
jgi:hypothetical protein